MKVGFCIAVALIEHFLVAGIARAQIASDPPASMFSERIVGPAVMVHGVLPMAFAPDVEGQAASSLAAILAAPPPEQTTIARYGDALILDGAVFDRGIDVCTLTRPAVPLVGSEVEIMKTLGETFVSPDGQRVFVAYHSWGWNELLSNETVCVLPAERIGLCDVVGWLAERYAAKSYVRLTVTPASQYPAIKVFRRDPATKQLLEDAHGRLVAEVPHWVPADYKERFDYILDVSLEARPRTDPGPQAVGRAAAWWTEDGVPPADPMAWLVGLASSDDPEDARRLEFVLRFADPHALGPDSPLIQAMAPDARARLLATRSLAYLRQESLDETTRFEEEAYQAAQGVELSPITKAQLARLHVLAGDKGEAELLAQQVLMEPNISEALALDAADTLVLAEQPTAPEP